MPAMLIQTMTNPPPSAEQSWEAPWRRAEIPAAGGHGNARSVALCQAAVSCEEVNGVKLLSRSATDAIFDAQSDGVDLVLGVPVRFGVGWALSSPALEGSEAPTQLVADLLGPRACFWGGWGGSVVVNDVDAELTVAYMMNRMRDGTVGDVRGVRLLAAAQAAVA
jgi:hypothetical protein